MKKRILSLLLVLLLAVTLMCVTAQASSDTWDGRTSEAFAGGTGTSDDPYQIANGAQLYYLSLQDPSSTSKNYYALTADIDLGDKLFPMIVEFYGTLSGNGFEIKGININVTESTKDSAVGLIGNLYGSVKDLTVSGTVKNTLKSGKTGGIAGICKGTVENCVNFCSVVSSSTAGGLVGYYGGVNNYGGAYNTGRVIGCSNYGDVNASTAGGIVGDYNRWQRNDPQHADKSILKCMNSGSISGDTAGGICGHLEGGGVMQSCNVGDVTAKSDAGGIIGSGLGTHYYFSSSKVHSYIYTAISDCFNTGTVSGKYAGGIAGYFKSFGTYGYGKIINCYNVGVVSADGGKTGEILGVNSSDIVADNYYAASTTNCFYLDENNPEATYYQGTARSAEELRTAGAYTSFDFSSIWGWDSNGGYPYAVLQEVNMPRSACEHDYVLTGSTASCLEAGEATYTCSKCGDIITEVAPATGHTEETVAAVAATCTTAGKTEGTVCSVCGEVLIAQEEIPALGHKTELCNAVEPTCTEAGYTGDEVCTICGETIKEGEVIPATGHHFKGNTCPDCGETRSTADTIRAWFQESFNNMKNFFDKIFGRN